jgi:hypothetical protein
MTKDQWSAMDKALVELKKRISLPPEAVFHSVIRGDDGIDRAFWVSPESPTETWITTIEGITVTYRNGNSTWVL